MYKTHYITPDTAEFYKTLNGFLGLKEKVDHGRVNLYRSFPFKGKDAFISVRNMEEKEIGIIKDLEIFQGDMLQIMQEELNRRYFLPKIIQIHKIKDNINKYFWKVETDKGTRDFEIDKNDGSIVHSYGNSILITDIDRNRYEIEDYTQLDKKSLKKIQLLL